MEPYIIGSLRWKKTCALKQTKKNFYRSMTLSSEAKSDIQWWIDSISVEYNPVNHGDPHIIMTTDASLSGWGACLDGMTTGGRWNPDEATHDINYLEMLAVLFALQSFSDKVLAKHIKLMVDNTIAVATINQMGTCHSNLNNKLEQQIWEWCILHGVWLTVSHIPGKCNTEADRESRLSRKETECCLDRSIYSAVIQKLVTRYRSVCFQTEPPAQTLHCLQTLPWGFSSQCFSYLLEGIHFLWISTILHYTKSAAKNKY